jgi:hypothetical protein
MGAVDSIITSRASYEVEATGSITTDIWTSCRSSMPTPLLAEIALIHNPEASKIRIENLDNSISNQFGLLIKTQCP